MAQGSSSEGGFSLIELMIVVAIIGILSTIAVPNYSVMVKTRLSQSILKGVAHDLQNARAADDGPQPLPVVSTYCAFCIAGLGTGSDMRTWTVSQEYLNIWKNLGYEKMPRDAWGNPVILDENDEEGGTGDCRHDSVWSAGPDGIWEGPGTGEEMGGDDLIVRIPHAHTEFCPP